MKTRYILHSAESAIKFSTDDPVKALNAMVEFGGSFRVEKSSCEHKHVQSGNYADEGHVTFCDDCGKEL